MTLTQSGRRASERSASSEIQPAFTAPPHLPNIAAPDTPPLVSKPDHLQCAQFSLPRTKSRSRWVTPATQRLWHGLCAASPDRTQRQSSALPRPLQDGFVSVQVVKASGGTTAYSDKHTGAYTILQGANGNALDEIYDPEQSANKANNITDSAYDMLHVRRSAQHCGLVHGHSKLLGLSMYCARVAHACGAPSSALSSVLSSSAMQPLVCGPVACHMLQQLTSIRGCAGQSSLLHLLCSHGAARALVAQYAAVNGWILGNSNGKYQTTYNGTLNATGPAITKQPTLFGTDLQCAPDLVINLIEPGGDLHRYVGPNTRGAALLRSSSLHYQRGDASKAHKVCKA